MIKERLQLKILNQIKQFVSQSPRVIPISDGLVSLPPWVLGSSCSIQPTRRSAWAEADGNRFLWTTPILGLLQRQEGSFSSRMGQWDCQKSVVFFFFYFYNNTSQWEAVYRWMVHVYQYMQFRILMNKLIVWHM